MKDAELDGGGPDWGPGLYSAWRTSALGTITDRLERRLILALVGDPRGRKVLDVGCGDGGLAVELSKRGAIVAAIDASNSMIEVARERAESHGVAVDFQVAAAQQLPFPSEQLDVVVAVTILCFVEDAVPVFKEMARVLRPGGHLVIGELGKWSSWAAARRVRGWLGSALWRKARFRTARELRALASQAGLEAGPVCGAVYFPRWDLAARLLAPCDRCFSQFTTLGAAFLAFHATKPIRLH